MLWRIDIRSKGYPTGPSVEKKVGYRFSKIEFLQNTFSPKISNFRTNGTMNIFLMRLLKYAAKILF